MHTRLLDTVLGVARCLHADEALVVSSMKKRSMEHGQSNVDFQQRVKRLQVESLPVVVFSQGVVSADSASQGTSR